MSLGPISVPHVRGYDFGVGVDRLSGAAHNLVVRPTPSPPELAVGAQQAFDVTRISSSSELQTKLGLDVGASYGCAAFGAGASARFSFLQESSVHAASLFLAIAATVRHADLSIDHCALTAEAAEVAGRPDSFATRYGDMFCRACSRGGLFLGLMRVETRTSVEANAIEAELKGSYGLFSAEATTTFSEVTKRHDAAVYCTLYAEGGPALQLGDPTDPGSLLTVANDWMRAMVEDPARYARPLEWTLTPVRVADGPWPNLESVRHAQDVLAFCAGERTELLDELNLLDWIRERPAWFSWAHTPVTLADIDTAWRARQSDLDLLAACASAALDAPTSARMPAPYGAALIPAVEYRGLATPEPLPVGKPRPVPPGNQRDWRFCVKCYAMFFDGYAELKGRCPGGGGHHAAGLNFALAHGGDAA